MSINRDEVRIDPIIQALGNEVQIRANQLLIGCRIDITFYTPDGLEKLTNHYEKLQSQGKIGIVRPISEAEGTMVAISDSETEEERFVDIALRSDQDLCSLSFQTLKALVWYKWFLPIEEVINKQIRCLVDDSQAYALATGNTFDAVDEEIETIAIYLTNIIQEMAMLNSQIIQRGGRDE
jgi:hypothetical protein